MGRPPGTLAALATAALAIAACSSDPAPSCKGTAVQCSSVQDQTGCGKKRFCHWEEGQCGGVLRTPCSKLTTRILCNQTRDCFWSDADGVCQGTTACIYPNTPQSSCEALIGCSWEPGKCAGPFLECEPILREEGCLTVLGCEWR